MDMSMSSSTGGQRQLSNNSNSAGVDFGKLVSTAQNVRKIQSAATEYADQIEIDTQHSYGAPLIDSKKERSQDDLQPLTDKQLESRDDQNLEKLKKLIGAVTQSSVMDFVQNGNYEVEVLGDLVEVAVVLFQDYLFRDKYKSGQSALLYIFTLLQEMSLRNEVQELLLGSGIFIECCCKYSKLVLQMEVFWQRELTFVQIIANLLSTSHLIDFTHYSLLSLADILITFYDYTKKDHTDIKKQQEKTKRKDMDRTPPLLFEAGEQTILVLLSLLPAYLVEYAAPVKYKLAERFNSIKLKNSTDKEQLQKLYTSLSILCRMCLDTIEKNEISKNLVKILDNLKTLLTQSPSIIKRRIIYFFRAYVMTTDMRCWLKFCSPYFAIDASGMISQLSVIGTPRYLGAEIGLFQKWGGYFDEGDAIFLKQKVNLDKLSQIRSYSISLWFIYPFRTFEEYISSSQNPITLDPNLPKISKDPSNNNNSNEDNDAKPVKQFRTFIQCESGIGCILGILNETHAVFFDDEFKMHSFEMITKNKGWNNIILKVDNQAQNVKIFLNRKEIANKFNVTISRNIAFVGNSFEKNEPCGAICDLRIFDSIIPDELVEKIVHYNKMEGMPDISHFVLEKNDICKLLEDMLEKNKKDEQMIIEILNCLSALATNQYTKSVLISLGFFQKAVSYSFHNNFQIRLASQRAILHLN